MINSAFDEVEVTEVGKIKKIPLYSGDPGDCEADCVGLSGSACCGTDGYDVQDVGCIKVEEVNELCPVGVPYPGDKVYLQGTAGHSWLRSVAMPQACSSTCGGVGEGIPGPGDIVAVGLIQ